MRYDMWLKAVENYQNIKQKRRKELNEIYKEVKHGHWVYHKKYLPPLGFAQYYSCSICGHAVGLKQPKYCENCGAKMDEVAK